MKRRAFGILAGSNFAAAAAFGVAGAQPVRPDPSLLGASLTPMGGERAGNADGSIPPWTGGLTGPPLPVNQPVDVNLFAHERPLRTVDARNMAQFAALLTPGTQAMIQQFGFRLKQYETRRTAAAPQYVYDNTARNMVRARLDSRAGQTGFWGAYGGVPFPVIDTADPLAGGTQLIWNHLTAWAGYSGYTKFSSVFAVADGKLTLSSASLNRFQYPFYDPNGSLQTYGGWYSEVHSYYRAPSILVGCENIGWHSTDTRMNQDILWVLSDGEARMRKDPLGTSYGAFNPAASRIASLDEYSCFYGSPAQYDWRYAGKREMLVPYNCNEMNFHTAQEILGPDFPNPEIVRWEKHRVWVVEASLRAGQTNALALRRFYIDEDSWSALLGEGYDAGGALIKYYAAYNHCVPSIPATSRQGSLVYDLRSGNYVYAGSVNYQSNIADEFIGPQTPTQFDPLGMAVCPCF